MSKTSQSLTFIKPHCVPGVVLSAFKHYLILLSEQPYEVWSHYYLHLRTREVRPFNVEKLCNVPKATRLMSNSWCLIPGAFELGKKNGGDQLGGS